MTPEELKKLTAGVKEKQRPETAAAAATPVTKEETKSVETQHVTQKKDETNDVTVKATNEPIKPPKPPKPDKEDIESEEVTPQKGNKVKREMFSVPTTSEKLTHMKYCALMQGSTIIQIITELIDEYLAEQPPLPKALKKK